MTLLLSGQPAYSTEDTWGEAAWRPHERSGYEAGYGAPEHGPYGRDPRRHPVSGASAREVQAPSWAPGEGPILGQDVGRSDDYRNGNPPAWGQGGLPEPQRQVPSGVYADSDPDSPFTPSPLWQGPPDYGPGYGDYAFRPWGQSDDGLELGPGQIRPPPGPFDGPPFQDLYPGYRFRGDPPASSGQWPSAPHAMGYRFRPLTDQERGRISQGPQPRPSYPQGAGGLPFRGDPMFEPEATYGFEPNPWRSR